LARRTAKAETLGITAFFEKAVSVTVAKLYLSGGKNRK